MRDSESQLDMAISAEQQARDLMEQCGVEDAQSFTAGDVIALANFIAETNRFRAFVKALVARSGEHSFDSGVCPVCSYLWNECSCGVI